MNSYAEGFHPQIQKLDSPLTAQIVSCKGKYSAQKFEPAYLFDSTTRKQYCTQEILKSFHLNVHFKDFIHGFRL